MYNCNTATETVDKKVKQISTAPKVFITKSDYGNTPQGESVEK